MRLHVTAFYHPPDAVPRPESERERVEEREHVRDILRDG